MGAIADGTRKGIRRVGDEFILFALLSFDKCSVERKSNTVDNNLSGLKIFTDRADRN
jgi:hypothetical protein